ncbi:hyalin-like [Apostichopus japonicus]|uniref:hyalin-like n=1 Tax=Stichopus japonicus TaxID=307972 RepID=UPI003AB847BC
MSLRKTNLAFCLGFVILIIGTADIQAQTFDSIPPVINGCPDDIIKFANDSLEVPVFWSQPTASDNSLQQVNRISTHLPGHRFPVGRTLVTYHFLDTTGNVAICSFNVSVISGKASIDLQPPIISNCPSDINRVSDGNTFVHVSWTEPNAEDESGNVITVTSPYSSSGFYRMGSTTLITYAYRDDAGNRAECAFNIIISADSNVDNTPPVIDDCPNDAVLNINQYDGPISVTWDQPTATDDSGLPVIRFRTHLPGESFPLGITEVTYTFTDQSGNSAVCNFNVRIEFGLVDMTPPEVFNCPDTVSVSVPFGTQNTPISWIAPTATDDSGNVNVVPSHNPGFSFPIGLSVVTYTFADRTGNEASCTFLIFVTEDADSNVDNTPPVIDDCPNDAVLNINQYDGPISVTWDQPTATDDSGLPVIRFRTHLPGESFPLGITEVTYTFTDQSGNSAVCNFNVRIEFGLVDMTPPVVSNCPDTVSVSIPFGTQNTPISWIAPTATDDSGNVNVVPSHNPGFSFPIGLSVVTYTFADRTGNEASCTFLIFVTEDADSNVDNTPPVIDDCPNDAVLNINQYDGPISVTWDQPTATDDSGLPVIRFRTHLPGESFPLGITEVTYTFTDQSGNSAVCNFNVRIEFGLVDMTPPVVSNCPDTVSVSVPFGTQNTPISWIAPTATDDSGNVNVVPSHNSGFSFPIGLSVVTYTFADRTGNEASCTFLIIVTENADSNVDNTPPVIDDCPNDAVLNINQYNGPISVTWDQPTATDDSGLPVIRFRTHLPGESFPLGITEVTYTFTDQSGNSAVCNFNVRIEFGLVDMTPPVVSNCPDTVSVSVPFGTQNTPISWIAPTATDDSGTVNVVPSHNPGFSFPIGLSVVTYTFADRTGNEASCTFLIFVTEDADSNVDNTPPVIDDCPNDAVLNINQYDGPISVTWDQPTATDDSGLPVMRFRTHLPGESFPLGITEVTYTFTDQSGNSAVCNFNVRIEFGLVDMTPPVVSNCPDTVSVSVPFGTQNTPISWIAPTATDDSGNVNVVPSHNPGFSFPIGLSVVTYTFADRTGNEASCTFLIFVTEDADSNVDNTPPVIDDCPNDAVLNINQYDGPISVTWDQPTATDDSGLPVMRFRTHLPGESFPLGITEVTYTFTDQSGNSAVCNFNVRIEFGLVDMTPPVVSNCPDTVSVSVPFGTQNTPISWIAPTATDDSGNVNVVPSHNPGFSFPIGLSVVTYTFADRTGNEASCTFLIFVTEDADSNVDNTPPVIDDCPNDAVLNINQYNGPISVTWDQPTATDDSGLPVIRFRTHLPGESFPLGITEVTYTFTDQSGNSAVCNFNVRIEFGLVDMTPPVVSNCPDTVSVSVPFGTQNTPISWIAPTATDDSGNVNVVPSHNPGFSFPIGLSVVTYTFADRTGNEASCTFLIFVTEDADSNVDNTPPVIDDCPNDAVLNINQYDGPISVTWDQPTATDDSGLPVIRFRTHLPGESFPLGITEVTYTFTDQSGNSAVCNFNVRIEFGLVDMTPPVVSNCPDTVSVSVPFGTQNTPISWIAPTATDDSGNVNVVPSHNPGFSFPIGLSVVTYTFADRTGNEASCTFLIFVTEDADSNVDNTPPVIDDCPNDAVLNINQYDGPISVTWDQPTATDDSGLPVMRFRTHLPGESFPLGITEVTYTFTDQSGNSAVCNFNVRIEFGLVDMTPPVVSNCPDTVSVSVPFGTQNTPISWIAPTATDDSGNVNVVPSHNPGFSFPIGLSVVTYTFADRTGNEASCTFLIFVTEDADSNVDNTPPVIDDCPNDAVLNINQYDGPISVTWDQPTATDDSGLPVMRFRTHLPGESFPLGITEVTYTFTDQSGNSAVCNFNVRIEFGLVDMTPPVVSNCPDTVSVSVPFGTQNTPISWIAPTATDDSGNVNVVPSHNPGFSFPIGLSVVTYTFADRTGNEAICTFLIIVTEDDDIEPPVIDGCPSNEIVQTSNSYERVSWSEPTATDNSGSVRLVAGPSSSARFFSIGVSTIQYTFRDEAGNEANCSFNITIMTGNRGRRELRGFYNEYHSNTSSELMSRSSCLKGVLLTVLVIGCVIIASLALIGRTKFRNRSSQFEWSPLTSPSSTSKV